MKKSFMFICLSILVGAASAEWTRVPGTKYTLDASRTQYMSNGTIKVWVKYQLPKPVLKKMVSDLRKQGVTDDYSRYGYNVAQFAIRCAGYQFAPQQTFIYSIDGNVISSYQIEPGSKPFEPAVPESEGERLIKYACSQ